MHVLQAPARCFMRPVIFMVAAMGLCAVPEALAQTDVEELGRVHAGARPPAAYYDMLRRDPTAFQFSESNGWVRRGRALAAERQVARSAATQAALFAPQANFNGAGIMRGELNVPVFLILYQNTDSAFIEANLPRATMESRLYGTDAAPPYSIHTYYREISSDSILVNGTVLAWTRISQPDSVYEGDCNGLCSTGDMAALIQEVVQAHDDTVDYGQFDNDGPDGIPNSGDDDGVVDAIVLLHPEVDGSCKNVNSSSVDNIWAHRFRYSGWAGAPLATNDLSGAGSPILVNDYIVQGGQGGDGGCQSNFPQAMGVVAHETGHLFGLPDLYDTDGGTQGIGHWGLMGSGNWQEPTSPAHMEAWSQARLGWITEVVIASDTTLEISPIETSDTAFVVPIEGADEYFLLENRQRIGSDSLMHGPGLLIWHVDTALINARRPSNRINATLPHGLALEQADGRTDLQQSSGGNRGDAGDPFPGSAVNRRFGPFTTPASDRNDGTPTYTSVLSIDYVGATETISALIRFQRPSLIAASDTMATFRLDSVSYQVFDSLLLAGTDYELDMDSVQVVNDGGNRYTWVSWSNAQPRTHTFTATSTGDTITASVAAEFLVQATVAGPGGTVTATPAVDLSGEFVAQDSTVQLVATVTQAGHVFEGWSGDTTAAADTLDLDVQHPFRLTATFAAPLALAAAALPNATMGAPFEHQLTVTGGVDAFSWVFMSGALPAGVALEAQTGTLVGLPTETGTFQFEVGVSSGSQSVQQSYELVVVAPALVLNDVVTHIVDLGNPLSLDEIKYLDLLGNGNSALDIGDFLAWVTTGAVPVSPETVSQVVRAAEGRSP
ncbi:MAG: M6 family metalloprotease domain-containing protein [Gemmatimonadota bacterium]|nr:M6 family metalloprotease domain-containing protein [Gemmatimonadota bacterium]